MPTPIAICIERIGAPPGAARFIRCVALVGRQPGLRLGADGEPLWQTDDPVTAELWVSGDERLILYRPAGAPPLTLSRANRALDVPEAKPVVAIDQDEVALGGCRLRLHVHGPARAVAAPSPLPEGGVAARGVLARAAAVAIGTAVAAGCNVEVRTSPPYVAPDPPPPEASAATTNTIEVRELPPDVEVVTPAKPSPPIEVRETPPAIAVP